MRDRPGVERALSWHETKLKFRPMRRYLVAAAFIVVADLAASGAPRVAEFVDSIKSRLGERADATVVPWAQRTPLRWTPPSESSWAAAAPPWFAAVGERPAREPPAANE